MLAYLNSPSLMKNNIKDLNIDNEGMTASCMYEMRKG